MTCDVFREWYILVAVLIIFFLIINALHIFKIQKHNQANRLKKGLPKLYTFECDYEKDIKKYEKYGDFFYSLLFFWARFILSLLNHPFKVLVRSVIGLLTILLIFSNIC